MTIGTFDDPRGRQSEQLAYDAERAENADRMEEAYELYTRAAELEEAVAIDVPLSTPRVKKVISISAIALWVKAGKPDRATVFANRCVAEQIVTEEDLNNMVDVHMAALYKSQGGVT